VTRSGVVVKHDIYHQTPVAAGYPELRTRVCSSAGSTKLAASTSGRWHCGVFSGLVLRRAPDLPSRRSSCICKPVHYIAIRDSHPLRPSSPNRLASPNININRPLSVNGIVFAPTIARMQCFLSITSLLSNFPQSTVHSS
jgi:hypothetical protein